MVENPEDPDPGGMTDWMPDSLSEASVRSVLDDPGHEQFTVLAAKLLEATEDLDEVTRWLDRSLLVRHFRRIRSSMGRTGTAGRRLRYWERRLSEGEPGDDRPRDLDQRELLTDARDEEVDDSGPSSSVQVGETIRRLRERKGLTQAELGDRLGVSRQAISKVEQGRENVTVRRLERIMRALNYRLRFRLEALPET